MKAVLALAGVNLLGVVLFGLLYGVGATNRISPGLFRGGLVVGFLATTTLWVQVERSMCGRLVPIRRVGRALGALALTIVGAPALVLTPLFALDAQLPIEVGFADVVTRTMVLLLLALVITVAMNVAAGATALTVGIARRS